MIRTPSVRHAIVAAIVSVMTATFAWSQAAINLGVEDHDNSAPIEITSESLQLNQETSTAEFSGDVLVRQGQLTMSCDRMLVEYGPNAETGENEIKIIRMFGGVTLASPSENAEADAAIYNLQSEILTMSGNVLVTQGAAALSSDQLTYNLDNGSGVLEGNVKTVLQQAGN